MILYFANRSFDILGMASTASGGLDVYDDRKTEEIGAGGTCFECTIPFSDKNRKEVESYAEPGNYLLRKNGDENEFYTIIESEIDTGAGQISVYAEEAGLDLLNEIVLPYEADQAYPAAYYIDRYTHDSGFEIGINEIAHLSRKLKWEGESTVTERILSIATQFDNAEIAFSFEVKDLTVVKKYINIYKSRGQDTGVELRLDRDIDNIVTTKSIANLATALYVTGGTPEGAENPITLAGYQYDDGRFHLDGPWLKDREANKIWSRYLAPFETGTGTGHIMATYSYDTVSQSELCNRAVSKLKQLSQPEVNYQIDIAKLPAGTKIGDTVNIVDDAGGLYLSARILKLETSVTNDTAKATLGNYLIKSSGISQKIEELAEQFKEIAKSRTLYTWIAYANDALGNGISMNPDGKQYMGTAANRLSDTVDLSDPSIYTWVKVRGEDGIDGVQGLKGEDGKSSYTHIAYANSANGVTDFSLTDSNRDYIGMYVDNIQNGSTRPGDYAWSKIKGADGAQGTPGKTGADGKTPYLHIAYANNSTGTSGFSTTVSTNKLYIGQYTDYIPEDSNSPSMYSWTKIKGDTGATGPTGEKGDSGIIISSYAPSNPTVGQLWQTSSGQPIKRWNGSSWVLHYISVDNLDVGTLSAISANLGTVTAGRIGNDDSTVVLDIENGIFSTRSINPYNPTRLDASVVIKKGSISVSFDPTRTIGIDGDDININGLMVAETLNKFGRVVRQGSVLVNNATASTFVKIVQLTTSEFSSYSRYIVLASNGDSTLNGAPLAAAWVRVSDRWVLGWSPTEIVGQYRVNYRVIKLP